MRFTSAGQAIMLCLLNYGLRALFERAYHRLSCSGSVDGAHRDPLISFPSTRPSSHRASERFSPPIRCAPPKVNPFQNHDERCLVGAAC